MPSTTANPEKTRGLSPSFFNQWSAFSGVNLRSAPEGELQACLFRYMLKRSIRIQEGSLACLTNRITFFVSSVKTAS